MPATPFASRSAVVGCILVFVLLSAGCGGEESATGFQAVDSAEVQIDRSPSPLWTEDEGWTIADTPRGRIGAREGDPAHELFRVYDATRFADGRIVVGNSGTSELRYFDAGGDHLRTVGGRGEGPGEFAEFSAIRFCHLADGRLLASDGGNGRIHVFESGGEFVETSRIEAVGEGGSANLVDCISEGEWLGVGGGGPLRGEPGDVISSRQIYFRYGPDGSLRNRIFEVESRPRLVHRVGSVTHYPFIPLAPQIVVGAAGGEIHLGQGDAYRVEVYGSEGGKMREIRWNGPERTRTSEVYDRYIELSLESIGSEEQRRRYARLYERDDLPLPDRVPAFGEPGGTAFPVLLVDALGHLWVQRYRLSWETDRTWDVFRPDGRWLGAVSAPEGLRLLEVGEARVLVHTRDDLGVELIQVHDLDRQP